MEGISIRLVCWEDGEKVEKDLECTDRWTLHSAVELQESGGRGRVAFPWAEGVSAIRLKQQPHALGASRMGVGACLWEGELLLAAYLSAQPLHRYIGARVVELGSGPGLIGLLMAKLGARVVITDIAKVLDLTRENVALNGLQPEQRRGASSGYAEVSELEWGKDGYEAVCASLASTPVDWVLAADCCYFDGELEGLGGSSPSTAHFVRACHALCGGATRCLVSFELRSSHVKRVFLAEAGRAFGRVVRVPPKALPKGCQVEHIELYELSDKRAEILPMGEGGAQDCSQTTE